jgi:2-dehydro-3-deoxygluconokinase
MFFEPGPAPRNARVIYDRKHSAAADLAFEDAPWEALIAASARIHLSGITPALGPSCRALVAHVAALAANAGKPVSYDLNYRSTLTTAAEARAMLDTVAPYLELFVVAERDAQAVLGFTESAERLAEAIAARYGVPLVALTRPPGEEPGGLLLARGTVRHAPRYPVEIVDRIGAGDSFVAGLIHGLLESDLDLAIRLAAYAGAVGLATPGDINYFGPEDLAAFHENTLARLLRSAAPLSAVCRIAGQESGDDRTGDTRDPREGLVDRDKLGVCDEDNVLVVHRKLAGQRIGFGIAQIEAIDHRRHIAARLGGDRLA